MPRTSRYSPRLLAMRQGVRSVRLWPAGGYAQGQRNWQAAIGRRVVLYGQSEADALTCEARDRALGQWTYFLGSVALMGLTLWAAVPGGPANALPLLVGTLVAWNFLPLLPAPPAD